MSSQTPALYQATWSSLAQHPIPDWLLDAKFGIYAHWGLYSVPAFETEWYAKRMYDRTHRVYRHHVETYGPPEQFGYKDFVPHFAAEHYDPDEWAEIIARSGARYAGIALVHHDGFCLWDSAHTRWNAARMGPKRDLYGELVAALRQQQLKTIATFHHIRTFNWYLPEDPAAREVGRQAGWDLYDPQYADLYWNEYTGQRDDFIAEWRAKVTEVIDAYRPDVIWFDGGSFQDEVSGRPVRELLAGYYNREQQWGKHVEILNKLPTSMKWNFGPDMGMLTYEQGRDRPAVVHRPWTDDMPIGSPWGYVEGMTYREPREIVHGLIDRTSRNGGMLLSLSPKADGTLPAEQKEILHKVGAWLDVNGDAIYGTRPWTTPAEGPATKFVAPPNARGHRPWIYQGGDAGDIRYTQKDGALYAIALGWPPDGRLNLHALGAAQEQVGKIANVSLLGHNAPLSWRQGEQALTVEMPATRPCDHAYAFRISVS
jgi:alpha-L-fucosidase